MDELTPRLEKILNAVVAYHISTGRPVGSKYLCLEGDFGLASSTVRHELARLEAMGYLDHPHTSAGRVPTDQGYRFYVDRYFRERSQGVRAPGGRHDELEGEIEEALRYSASRLARTTGLLALVSAPMQNNTAIKHVEVLLLHPDLVMVVIITASGGIIKKLVMFDGDVDPGLVNWARSFLSDAIRDFDLGSRRLRLYLEEADLGPTESAFLKALAPAFLEEPDGGVGGLYVDGLSKFLSRVEAEHSVQTRNLMGLLDRQDKMLRLLTSELMEQRVYLRIGREMPGAAMQGCSLVAANYGVAHRNLGTVGVLGPTRMDYQKVIGNVELTARSLSRFVEEIFN
jgi:heat-inducible transcriptional repressor